MITSSGDEAFCIHLDSEKTHLVNIPKEEQNRGFVIVVFA